METTTLRACTGRYQPPSQKKPTRFTPHLTLLYDKELLAPQSVEPVSWTAKEIVLALGEAGAKDYHRLGSWVLGE